MKADPLVAWSAEMSAATSAALKAERTVAKMVATTAVLTADPRECRWADPWAVPTADSKAENWVDRWAGSLVGPKAGKMEQTSAEKWADEMVVP